MGTRSLMRGERFSVRLPSRTDASCVSEPIGFAIPRFTASTPAMSVVATAPSPGRRTARRPSAGAMLRGFLTGDPPIENHKVGPARPRNRARGRRSGDWRPPAPEGTMKTGMPDEKRRDPRVGAELRLRLAYGSMDEFIERYATNVSRGGIFVRTLEPWPPGTELAIDVALANGDQVLRGRGVVRWRTPPSAPGEPPRDPGMGVRFTELAPESRALVDLMVATVGAEARSEEPPVPPDVDLLDLDMGEAPAATTATASPTPTANA